MNLEHAGFADWLQIARSTPLWRTATAHMIAMLIATAFFLVAIGAGYSDGMNGAVADGAFLVEEPAHQSVSPVPKPEEEAAEN